ncbi:MAG: response regulator [Drouetiella hepatica Uher 2000/2452]|jgi:DNA-binding response OmpR family regulator/HPt (histidine-containing phosphotransfer) domain-containing protein|uniref:Response regulator n=1 Tax=Drouetiella hepatica Uher 2000/2452 TaxID=904376 RepID=A0A951Q9D3_9CYAN|nr:response regulator [Drouetiella hepatica Uher 2000/2452]
MKILLVEDDESLIALLTRSLVAQRYVVDAVKDGEMGWSYGSTFEYDLILMDLMLPKLDGISLCQRFRAEGYTTPIMLLTAQDNSTAKVQGLDAGADDYVVKPFDQAELIARIRALLRRGSTQPFPLLTCGDLLLDPSTCEVSYDGQPLILTTKEYELLELLLRDSQHVLSTDEILDRLWSSEKFPSEATVRSHIRRLRHKLVAAGAPSDFIATLHGRGYYLKALEPKTEEATMPHLKGDLAGDLAGGLAIASTSSETSPFFPISQPDSQRQYLTFLNETWATTQPKCLAQTEILLQAAAELQGDRLSHPQQVQAQQVAHKLAGTLGVFGLTQAMHLSRQLEHWLGETLHPKQAELMQTLAIALQQEIKNNRTIQAPQIVGRVPLLLVVSTDAKFNQSLMPVAIDRGIHIRIAPEIAPEIASLEPAEEQSPDVILFRFPDGSPKDPDRCSTIDDLWKTLQTWVHRHPALPILVVGDRSELSDRLKIVRSGGKLFLEPSAVPDQVISAAVRLLRGSDSPARVMIVDDDQNWLRMLPTLLKPWGFKVTTLADPQQFLTVLQSVMPDLLVLDVNMPQVNGFELCQILRSDPDWQRLPVLFLSVLTDAASQNQAFTVGADDYLCKPIMGVELANRILRRLQRVRAWAG